MLGFWSVNSSCHGYRNNAVETESSEFSHLVQRDIVKVKKQ
jgi:hypothetical protein